VRENLKHGVPAESRALAGVRKKERKREDGTRSAREGMQSGARRLFISRRDDAAFARTAPFFGAMLMKKNEGERKKYREERRQRMLLGCLAPRHFPAARDSCDSSKNHAFPTGGDSNGDRAIGFASLKKNERSRIYLLPLNRRWFLARR